MLKFMSQVSAGIAALLIVMSAHADSSHRVEPGETLTSIAGLYGIETHLLAESNGISDYDYVQAGQLLHIPRLESVGPLISYGFHLVAPGESLGLIAARYGTTVEHLSDVNALENPDFVFAGQTLEVPSSGPVAPLGIPRYTKDEAAWALYQAELEFGLPPGLLRAVAWQESGWQSWVISHAGAIGLTQIMPDTGNWVVAHLLPDAHDWAVNPTNNARVGGAFLRYLLDLTGWDVPLTLAGYYQGLANVARFGYYEDTVSYVANVQFFRSWFA